MLNFQLSDFYGLTKEKQTKMLASINAQLDGLSAEKRICWALDNLEGECVLSSSFGIQSAVMLHLLIKKRPNIPVILTDTGYLFPETYRFIETLTCRLSLNLQVYRAPQTPAWQEAKWGKLWEQGIEGIEKYNKINKVEPMRRAFEELKVGTWFSGLRKAQSRSRHDLSILAIQHSVFKFLPLLDWSNKDIHDYLKTNDLPYHPLWEQGYVSVGDVQTTRKLEEGMSEEDTRFFGLKRECGLHEEDAIDGAGI